jgi:hypothetical protein
LLLVENRMLMTNTPIMTGTTTNGEEICMGGKLLASYRLANSAAILPIHGVPGQTSTAPEMAGIVE